ncbi:hypothetical protein QTP70_015105 [Hemibagrus guttatus]|uniref:Protein Wnt n=1 Tax=Hemibagrus guttatus TaxID=175788 RepID=A0AAE0QP39_9TELE|nr:hypothetical protein QTP70_015105 [Hemibagrus guttatus]
MEKYRDGQRELHCVFVDLEKAYDRVPREELWYCMRKSGVAEKYVRVVQDMYERSRTVVRCAVGQTEEFNVEVGLHQGSALSPFLFAIVMDQLSEEVRQESPWTMMFADDIVICSESREQVEENLERWRFALERRGMKASRSKTEYMCVNEREGSGTVRLQGEEVKKVQEFKYLGSTVQSNGECGKETFRELSIPSPRWKSYVLINRHFRPHKKTYLMDLYLVGYLHLLCMWLSSSRVLGGYPIWWRGNRLVTIESRPEIRDLIEQTSSDINVSICSCEGVRVSSLHMNLSFRLFHYSIPQSNTLCTSAACITRSTPERLDSDACFSPCTFLRSLALGQQYSSLGSQPILCGSIPGLVPKQLRFCRNYIEIMPSVAEGVKLGIQECQHQFRGRRWNCTTIKDNLAIFGPVLDKATRESAFVHAIASAGVAFAVTRSCAEGTSTMCGCDSHHKGPPGEGWKWGGCSEDAEFGVLVSREFADARENRPDARSAMNRHNNEAGRMTILENMHLRCKCHGLSGSCEVKTCWWAQPDFRLLGDYLKDKYDSASEMVVEKHRESRGWVETLRAKYAFFKHPTERDLVYYEGSPNFCEPNPETGSFGTRDRSCNVSSHGIEGCDLLCCGRGHNTRTEKRKEKCHCIFHWCCYVSCQECVRVYDVHTCK